jgi:uncharacterized membrane protein YbhN (UPF0104 family)
MGLVRGHRSWFARLHEHPAWVVGAAVALAGLALVIVSWVAGWHAVGAAFAAIEPRWIALCVLAQGPALVAYAVAYRSLARLRGGPDLTLAASMRIVLTGFGAFAAGGGFAIDRRALHAPGESAETANVRVVGIGALEYAVLAPAACACAIVLLASGDGGVRADVLWPWAILVPLGFAAAMWYTRRRRGRRPGDERLRTAVEGVGLLRELAAHPHRHAGAWLGMSFHWAAEIASLYGALRLFGAHLGAPATILAYATGYAATRRTLPLGGAGLTEALMSLALLWAGLPLARAVPAVLAYRVANLLLPVVPALRSHRAVKPLLDEGDARRTATSAS